MNILENISINLDKPSVFVVKRTDKSKIIAVGLGENTVLKKHKTPVTTTLIALKGEISFEINGEKLSLKTADIFEIPIDVEHEVLGIGTENIFIINQEL